jgi:hypothetical protein
MSKPIDRDSALFRIIERQLATAIVRDHAEGADADFVERGAMVGEHTRKVLAELLGAIAPLGTAPHTDDVAVDRFAAAMRQKMATSREKGRGGWETASQEHLSNLLHHHNGKGDPVDVANIAMMLWTLGFGIAEATVPIKIAS